MSSPFPRLLPELFGIFFNRQRRGEEVALYIRAIQRAQEIHLILGLHALGGGIQPQLVAQAHDLPEHDLALAVADAVDQALIQLDGIDKRQLEHRQGGLRLAEVVDLDAEAVAIKLLKDGDHRVVGDHRAFRHLQRHHPRGQAVALQNTLIRQRHALTAQRRARQVDRHRPNLKPFPAPLAELRADAGEHVFIQLADGAVLFKQRDKAIGREHGAVLLHPANQRLAADDFARFGVALRLIIHLKLVLADGLVEAILQLHVFKESVLIQILIKRSGVVGAAPRRAQRQIRQLARAAGVLLRAHRVNAEPRHEVNHAHFIRQAANPALNLAQPFEHRRALALHQMEGEGNNQTLEEISEIVGLDLNALRELKKSI